MILMLTVGVWAIVLGISPGLALIAVPLTVLILDRQDQTIVDRLLRREVG